MPIPETVEQIEAALAHKTVYEAAVLVHEWLHPLPPGGFVRVRIAVGVADDGEWIANGWKNSCDGDVIDEMSEPYRDHIVFIEADVQPPQPAPTIKGRVVSSST